MFISSNTDLSFGFSPCPKKGFDYIEWAWHPNSRKINNYDHEVQFKFALWPYDLLAKYLVSRGNNPHGCSSTRITKDSHMNSIINTVVRVCETHDESVANVKFLPSSLYEAAA